MIRHAGSRLSPTILPLPVAMIQPSFPTLLMSAVGTAPSPDLGGGATSGAAIAVPTIAVLTDPEHRAASAASPLTENYFAMNRHARPQTGLDKGNRSMAG
jgi:hypothetical protein